MKRMDKRINKEKNQTEELSNSQTNKQKAEIAFLTISVMTYKVTTRQEKIQNFAFCVDC